MFETLGYVLVFGYFIGVLLVMGAFMAGIIHAIEKADADNIQAVRERVVYGKPTRKP